MTKIYEPELGQAVFGQSTQEYKIQEEVEIVLTAIRSILLIMRPDEDDPFGNTGACWSNNVFEVESYSWDEDVEQKYNFKWNNFTVSWYKYLGRGSSQNKLLTLDEIKQMTKECVGTLLEEI